MKEIQYFQQPTAYLCGQACVAMIAQVSVDDVIRVMNNDKATGKKDIERALDHYGIRQAKTMTKADNNTPLPPVCLLKVLLLRYSHWILYYHGKYYDPEFGLTDGLYGKAKIQSYTWSCSSDPGSSRRGSSPPFLFSGRSAGHDILKLIYHCDYAIIAV